MCIGNESSLLNCDHNGLENHNCVHSEDAGVHCPCKDLIMMVVYSTTYFPVRDLIDKHEHFENKKLL